MLAYFLVLFAFRVTTTVSFLAVLAWMLFHALSLPFFGFCTIKTRRERSEPRRIPSEAFQRYSRLLRSVVCYGMGVSRIISRSDILTVVPSKFRLTYIRILAHFAVPRVYTPVIVSFGRTRFYYFFRYRSGTF